MEKLLASALCFQDLVDLLFSRIAVFKEFAEDYTIRSRYTGMPRQLFSPLLGRSGGKTDFQQVWEGRILQHIDIPRDTHHQPSGECSDPPDYINNNCIPGDLTVLLTQEDRLHWDLPLPILFPAAKGTPPRKAWRKKAGFPLKIRQLRLTEER